MDIIAALHWLQENIGAFGGDARSVTLAGHGTGAACVHFLMTSNAVPEGKFCEFGNPGLGAVVRLVFCGHFKVRAFVYSFIRWCIDFRYC